MLIFIAVDFLRLRVRTVKDIFIIIFGSLLRRHEFSSLTGGTYLMIAATFAVFAFEDRGIFMASIMFLAVGDTVAALFGLSHGRTKIFGKKTLEGTFACLLFCLLCAYILSSLPNLSFSFTVGLWGAITATVVEALPIEVNDNVVIPLTSGVAMTVASVIIR